MHINHPRAWAPLVNRMDWHELVHEVLAQEPDSPTVQARLREGMERYLIDHPEASPDYTAARRHFNRVVGLKVNISKLHALVGECQKSLPGAWTDDEGSSSSRDGARWLAMACAGPLSCARERIDELSLYSGHLERLGEYLPGEADILSYRVRCAEGLTLDTLAQACDAAPLLADLGSGLMEAKGLLLEEEGRYRSAMEREISLLLRKMRQGAITPGGP